VLSRQHTIEGARALLEKRRTELYLTTLEKTCGPQGELRSAMLTDRVEMVFLNKIVDDDFKNTRLEASAEQMLLLTESMKTEGLKVPVTVICSSSQEGYFHARAGFRRIRAARELGWEKIPAVILPYDTPVQDEYWTNIIENVSREKLSTYEIAKATQTMRDQFGVRPSEFARRSGLAESYVLNLLRCIEKLPDEVVGEWKQQAPIPVSCLVEWSKFSHPEATKMMLSYRGRNPQVTQAWVPDPGARRKVAPLKMASSQGLKRMQRLRIAVEVAQEVDLKTREICLALVDYCSGARDDVPGIFKPAKKEKEEKELPAEAPSTPPTDDDL
jgi:ParB/RepB/Spo0J family partition protein